LCLVTIVSIVQKVYKYGCQQYVSGQSRACCATSMIAYGQDHTQPFTKELVSAFIMIPKSELPGGCGSVSIIMTTHNSLPTAHCPLPTAHCSLLTAHCSLLTAHCSLLTAHCSLLTAHCSLCTPLNYRNAFRSFGRNTAPVTPALLYTHCLCGAV
jgi:hypothetical protein